MQLADSGFYFHLSRLVNTPEEYQYMQVLFVFNPRLSVFGRGDSFYLKALPKLLGLPTSGSYIAIYEFVSWLYERLDNLFTVRPLFEAFQRDPARSGRFHHDPGRWHAFVATRFLRFLATATSQ